MASKTIWRVSTRDSVYSGNRNTYLLEGKNAAAVEKKAIGLATGDVLPAERKPKPYVSNIELIGDLDG